MTENNSEKKVAVILCVCTGDCPGFAKMKIWDVVNQARLGIDPVSWAVVHPQLCETDGERFCESLINPTNPIKYVIAGCSPTMQTKLIGPYFKAKNLDFSKFVKAVDIRNMTSDQAVEAIKKKVDEWTETK
jgi:heterodisulfide reductase subunit A-like polyferredoxin